MIRKLLFMAMLVVSANLGHAQIDVVRTISLQQDNGQDKLYLLHEDSTYRILAPESAINEVLKPFKETNRLRLAFRELNDNNSTNYEEISVKRGLASETQYLIHELMERGDCLVEKKKDEIKVKLVVAMTYKDKAVEGIKYMIGDHTLYNYILPEPRRQKTAARQ